MSILATQRPLYVRLILADGSEQRVGPFVTADSAWAAARRWLGDTYAGARVLRVKVVKT